MCVAEPQSVRLRRLARANGIVTSFLSAVEIASAIERRRREDALDPAARAAALANLAQLATSWVEVTAYTIVRDRALRLLAVHPLRAADALQLAAALVATNDYPSGHHFICGDARLAQAASREGFGVVGS